MLDVRFVFGGDASLREDARQHHVGRLDNVDCPPLETFGGVCCRKSHGGKSATRVTVVKRVVDVRRQHVAAGARCHVDVVLESQLRR